MLYLMLLGTICIGGEMIYLFKCECGLEQKKNLPVSERDSQVLCECGSEMCRALPGHVNFSLKGWGWTGRDYKEKRTREKRSVDMALKQHERYGDGSKLVPNYKGQEADSWEQVRDQAVFEKGSTVAPQYTHLIEQEKKGSRTRSEVVDKTVRDMRS